MKCLGKMTAFVLAVLLTCASATFATAGEMRVFDQMDLFTAVEIAELEEEIAQFRRETGMDFVVLASDDSVEDGKQQDVADDFYDEGGFGMDEEHSGVLYYIDMHNRWHCLSTTGAMIDYMTDERIEAVIENGASYLKAGHYAEAVSAALGSIQRYIDAGIPEGQYRYDVLTGQRLTVENEMLPSGEMLMSAAVVFAGLCLAGYFLY